MVLMEVVQDIEERLRDCREGSWRDLGQVQSAMHNHSKEENPDWNSFEGYAPHPDNPHEFGKCMQDWHDYKWRRNRKRSPVERKWQSGRDRVCSIAITIQV